MGTTTTSMAETGACKLCHLARPLRRSHIVPEFLYGPVYKGEGVEHWTVGLWRDAHGSLKPRKVQMGLRERLLCDDCEDLLNREYEQPSVALWRYLVGDSATPPRGVTEQRLRTASGNEGTRFSGLDYPSWKLFLLSILWRASIADGLEWSGVALGQKHEAIVRSMLLSMQPAEMEDYPCIIYLVRDNPARMIVFPGQTRIDGHRCYLFHLTKVVLQFVVSSHFSPELTPHGVDPSGTFLAVHLGLDDVPGMKGVRRLMSEAGDLPASMR